MVVENDDKASQPKPLPHFNSLPYLGGYFNRSNSEQHQNGAPAFAIETTTSGSSDVDSNPSTPPGSPPLLRQSNMGQIKREYRPLIERMKKRIDSNDPFYSLEFFPPRTPNGVANLLARLVYCILLLIFVLGSVITVVFLRDSVRTGNGVIYFY